jgi:Neocarzinostatin family
MRIRRWGAVLLVVGVSVWGTGGPASAATSLAVTPSTNLVDGQLVSVAISGSPASTSIGVVECVLGAVNANGCDLRTLQYVTTDASGHVVTPFIVSAKLATSNGTVDCRTVSCSIGAGTFDLSATAGAPITFNPTGPLAPPLHMGVTVAPNGQVNNRTNVATITGTVTCNRAAIIDVSGQLTQTIPFHGVSLVSSSYFDQPQVICGAPNTTVGWTATAPTSSSVFPGGTVIVGYKVGTATANVFAYGNGGTSSAFASIPNATIRLRSAH